MSVGEIISIAIGVLMLLIFFLLVYLICCLPGALLLWAILRTNVFFGPSKEFIIALISAVFFTPYILAGHTVFVFPIIVDLIAPPLGGTVPPLWLFSGPIIVFTGTLLVRHHHSKRKRTSH